jgi:hypothetical protein
VITIAILILNFPWSGFCFCSRIICLPDTFYKVKSIHVTSLLLQ